MVRKDAQKKLQESEDRCGENPSMKEVKGNFIVIIFELSSTVTLVHSGANSSLPSMGLEATDFPQRSVLCVWSARSIGEC